MKDQENSSVSAIYFKETSSKAGDFLHELNDPKLLKNRDIPDTAKIELRRHQVARLRSTIDVLKAKRDEFNRRMDDYIGNLTKLANELSSGVTNGDTENDADGEATDSHCILTRVHCLHCSAEKCFEQIKVVFARESEESLSTPTELYVLDHGAFKKGHFCCEKCGTEGLVIKAN